MNVKNVWDIAAAIIKTKNIFKFEYAINKDVIATNTRAVNEICTILIFFSFVIFTISSPFASLFPKEICCFFQSL
jgi:hypothetical protein